jgi:PAS domain S-box-containing protein
VQRALRVLNVEDDENDAELMILHLRAAGYDVATRRVENARDMSSALREHEWDVVLSDFSLPRFSAPQALHVLREAALDIPFIIVSGTIAAERALPAMKAGARDFVLKGDLERLVPAIERELREAAGRRARRQAERALAESNERFRLLIEGVTDYAIMMLDPEGHIVSWNTGGERLLGFTENEVVGSSFAVVFTPEDVRAGVPAREMEQAIATGRAAEDRWHVRKDGSRWYATGVLSPLWNENGTLRGFSNVLRDITERKRIEDELARRTEELVRSNAELERYAYAASHDLQEPLRMITLYLQRLEGKLQGTLDEEARADMGYVLDGARRMHLLINDLLAMSQLAAEPHLEPIDCNAFVARAFDRLRDTITQTGAVITSGELPTIVADRRRIDELFHHLLGNALKFRGTRRPEIHVEASRGEGSWTFAIRDNGIGVEEEYHERIFGMFNRLHADRERYPGTGIGLAICKKIVQALRGRIWVESELGVGSTFYFTVPDPVHPFEQSGSSAESREHAS